MSQSFAIPRQDHQYEGITMATAIKTRQERRLQRARLVRQERHLLTPFGVLHTADGSFSEAQWRARRLAALHRLA